MQENSERSWSTKTQEETLEISSTGYGLESVAYTDDWGNNILAQKLNGTKSFWRK